MGELITAPTITCQWHTLITEARELGFIELSEEAESYLVFLLIRFMTQSSITDNVLGKEYLESAHYPPSIQQMMLQEVGDKCLLLAGFFPSQSKSLVLSGSPVG